MKKGDHKMRILLMTDTHGDLSNIDKLVDKTKADIVINGGDFGFYDSESPENLTERELNLFVIHSDIPEEMKTELLKLNISDKRQLIKNEYPLSDLPEYLNGRSKFKVPVYSVWGNHEDINVVNKFYKSEFTVPNLNIVHENSSYSLNDLHIFGLGGNFLSSNKLFQKPIAGGGGKVWSTFTQYADLIGKNSKRGKEKVRILISHVSPGKEPFITLAGILTNANYIISGHMGAPFCQVWNSFTIDTVEESKKRITDYLDILFELTENLNENEKNSIREKIGSYKRFILDDPEKEPWWYRNMHCINLPDAKDGYAILNTNGKKAELETFNTIS